MEKKYSVLSLFVAFILVFAFLGLGFEKAAQAKERGTAPAAQQAKPQTGKIAQAYNFETGAGKWWPVGNIKYVQVTDIKHSGKASLRISGTGPAGNWNYIESTRFILESGKKYKLTGWMLVKSISNNQYSPVLKVGIEQNRKWLANAITKKYDLNKKGKWQELSVEFTAPSDSDLKGYVSVEKTTKDAAIDADIYIDDIKVELFQ
jgi:hypothetical protein